MVHEDTLSKLMAEREDLYRAEQFSLMDFSNEIDWITCRIADLELEQQFEKHREAEVRESNAREANLNVQLEFNTLLERSVAARSLT